MAFVCILPPEGVSGSFFDRITRHSIMVSIGYDDNEDKSYNLFVTLDPLPPGDADFSFSIVEHDAETDTDFSFYNSGDVAKFIGAADRALILECLLGAAAHLLKVARPARVTMSTMNEGAPEKANHKFIALAHVFEACGYIVHTADSYHGDRAWWMELDTPSVGSENARES